MKLRELLNLIHNISVNNDIPTPYICGGTPRDKVLGKPSDIVDLDITVGSPKIHNLAKEISIEISKKYDIKEKQGDDGHFSILFPGNQFKLDFSSFALAPDIDKHLRFMGIHNPTDLQREAYSRDFFCNTLLLTLDLKTVKDPTKQGLKDIKNRIIRTCLDPNTTFHSNTNRIIRVIYLSTKLDFDVDPEIIKWISKNKDMVRLSSDSYLKKNLDKAMDKNPKRTVELIREIGLWDVIPITESLQPYANKVQVPVKEAQIKRNFDIGTGLFDNLDKYKSVSDFRKKRLNKRKKKLKNIQRVKFP
jgi:poly(A) polymerase